MNIFTPVQHNDAILLHGDKMITKETLANFDLFKGIPTDVLDEIAKFWLARQTDEAAVELPPEPCGHPNTLARQQKFL
jgi:hypothetical protein